VDGGQNQNKEGSEMAETKVRNRPAESGIARRPESSISREGSGPFAMMRRLSEEMDRAFARSFGLSRDFRDAGLWSPAIDVREQNGNTEIVAELPGMTKDDVKVECTDEGVVIEGEKRQEHEESREGFFRSERSYGHFCRMIPLPEGAEPEKAKAEFKDGLLRIHVPVPERKRQSRQIPIGT
jgi:HSP20 family protein